MAHEWPGNVRELENAIERAVLLAEGRPRIEDADLPPEVRGPRAARRSSSETIPTLAEVERSHVLATLEHFDGNRAKTAKALGIGESTLWRKLKAYGSGRRSRTSRRPARGVDR